MSVEEEKPPKLDVSSKTSNAVRKLYFMSGPSSPIGRSLIMLTLIFPLSH